MQIDLSRRFRKLRLPVDNFSRELGAKSGKLCLVSIAKGDSLSGRFFHEDGDYDFAALTPQNGGHCLAQVLSPDGSTKEVKFSYSESWILVPEDDFSFQIEHPGLYRKIHNFISVRKILEVMTGDYALINDNHPRDNSVYSSRVIESCDVDGYTASIIDSDGETKSVGFLYSEVAGIMAPKGKIPAEFVRIFY